MTNIQTKQRTDMRGYREIHFQKLESLIYLIDESLKGGLVGG